jgi:hypothetical protein
VWEETHATNCAINLFSRRLFPRDFPTKTFPSSKKKHIIKFSKDSLSCLEVEKLLHTKSNWICYLVTHLNNQGFSFYRTFILEQHTFKCDSSSFFYSVKRSKFKSQISLMKHDHWFFPILTR